MVLSGFGLHAKEISEVVLADMAARGERPEPGHGKPSFSTVRIRYGLSRAYDRLEQRSGLGVASGEVAITAMRKLGMLTTEPVTLDPKVRARISAHERELLVEAAAGYSDVRSAVRRNYESPDLVRRRRRVARKKLGGETKFHGTMLGYASGLIELDEVLWLTRRP